MANGFDIKQVSGPVYVPGLKAYEYRFHVRHAGQQSDLTATFCVSEATPESDRLDEAKKHFQAFVSALSAEVQAF